MIRILGIAQKENEVFLYYVFSADRKDYFKVTISTDGFTFTGNTKYVIVTDEKNREERNFNWLDFKVARQKEKYYAIYQLASKQSAIITSSSDDLIRFTKISSAPEIKESSAMVPDYKYKNKHVLYYGSRSIQMATSSNFAKWIPEPEPIAFPKEGYFDSNGMEVNSVFQLEDRILVLYHAKKEVGEGERVYVGACTFDKRDPKKLLWQSDTPIWEQPDYFNNEVLSPLGAVILNNELILYWQVGGKNVYAVSCPIPGRVTQHGPHFNFLLKKADKNPIISPDPKKPWESRATFNSAAVYEGGKVHFIYRALGDTDLSVLGYATSTDGLTIDERSPEPIYIPREPFETPGNNSFKTFAEHFMSGGGYGGIEDPKITKIGDRFYMTYVAFDGATPPRAALTSISVEDFLNRRWDKWETPKLISAPGMVNKSAAIFPEKINGKYAIFHRIYPNLLIDYVDDLEFNNSFLQGQYFIPPRKGFWDSKKLSAGAPPIRTEDGWLLIYHAVGHQEGGKYKVGAMLLDHDDPTKILFRTKSPIIEPNEWYENQGHKSGVVYPCGAVVKDGELFVYYGGADTVVCAASENLDKFMDQLKYNEEPKVKRVRGPMLN